MARGSINISGLFNILEDTTPQLGGELDQNGHTIGGIEYDNGTAVTSIVIDWRKGNHQRVTVGSTPCTFTFIAPSYPCMLSLRIINDATAGRTKVLPAIKWQSGISPVWTTTANAVDILNLYYTSSPSAIYYGQFVLDMS